MLIEVQEKIFKRWLDNYKLVVLKVVKTYTDLPQDRDDLFQEILLQIWSSIPNFSKGLERNNLDLPCCFKYSFSLETYRKKKKVSDRVSLYPGSISS